VPAVPSCIIEPIWEQFHALLPERVDTHPLGCHRPRVPDRIVFDKLVQVLVLGAAYGKIGDTTCSATTIRRRRDEWISAGAFAELEPLCLEAYDRIVGLELGDVSVDGCIVKAPRGPGRGPPGAPRTVLLEHRPQNPRTPRERLDQPARSADHRGRRLIHLDKFRSRDLSILHS